MKLHQIVRINLWMRMYLASSTECKTFCTVTSVFKYTTHNYVWNQLIYCNFFGCAYLNWRIKLRWDVTFFFYFHLYSVNWFATFSLKFVDKLLVYVHIFSNMFVLEEWSHACINTKHTQRDTHTHTYMLGREIKRD